MPPTLFPYILLLLSHVLVTWIWPLNLLTSVPNQSMSMYNTSVTVRADIIVVYHTYSVQTCSCTQNNVLCHIAMENAYTLFWPRPSHPTVNVWDLGIGKSFFLAHLPNKYNLIWLYNWLFRVKPLYLPDIAIATGRKTSNHISNQHKFHGTQWVSPFIVCRLTF